VAIQKQPVLVSVAAARIAKASQVDLRNMPKLLNGNPTAHGTADCF
jgi:hypothetical protein